MPQPLSTSSGSECTCSRSHRSVLFHQGNARHRRKRRRRPSCEDDRDQCIRRLYPKKFKTEHYPSFPSYLAALDKKSHYQSSANRFVVAQDMSLRPSIPVYKQDDTRDCLPQGEKATEPDGKCWIQKLPEEILLLIFSYLPLAMLLLVVPRVCKKWEALAMDWTLWKAVEHLKIKSMIVSTKEVRMLLKTIPKLKKLELILRNDAEELLQELFHVSSHLEVLLLDRCSRSGLHINISPNTVRSVLEMCPKLKSVTFTDTYFRCKDFYRALAERFRSYDRINISCTTKSEMDFFVDNLRARVPEMEFQNVSMMGRAEGKQIYWGPILGLVIRPNPTSPYLRQHTSNEFPNYAF